MNLYQTTMIIVLLVVFHVDPVRTTWAQENSSRIASRPLFGFAIRNTLMEERFHRTRNEQEAVSKLLMNTNVTGSQSTVTETRLRIVPDDRSLRFELLNSGDVTSQTTGFNSQATVDSLGQHHFEITKPLWFDGKTFLTLPAHGTIQASQTPQRVFSTAGATMPLLGPLSDRVAWNEVLRRTPQINQAVAEDVSRDVLPKVNRLIDEDFANLQKDVTTAQRKIDSIFGSTRLRWCSRSTKDVVSVWSVDDSLYPDGSVLAIPAEAGAFRSDESVVAFVSEDSIESLLTQYFPAGLKLTDKQLQKLELPEDVSDAGSAFTPDRLMSIFAALRSAASEEAALFTLELARKNPFQVRFADGDIRLITTFQIHPKGGAASGWMTTTFNLRGKKLSDDEWTIAIRTVDVGESGASLAAESSDESTEQLIIPAAGEEDGRPAVEKAGVTTVQAGTVWIPIIRNATQSLAEKIPPVRLPLEFDSAAIVPGAPRFRLAKIDSAKGMLRVGLKALDSGAIASGRQNQK
ncbi:MAG: hypothetical protein U0936_27665 [Planctomycetaceae bacterium]